LIFGGEKGKEMGHSMRNVKNDIIIYDPFDYSVVHKEFDRASFKARMYHCGFIIENYLYTFGGQTSSGHILEDNL
jgi:hypothetical protein